MSRIRNVADVAAWRMCVGCGACAYACPEDRISLVNFTSEGIRPVIADPGTCGTCTDCLRSCPAVQTSPLPPTPGVTNDPRFGPILEIWEGHAADPEIRHQGSSGGVLTALSLFCLEGEGMHGVAHIGQDPEHPLRNATRISRSRAELLACAGSRYAPASACDAFAAIEAAPAPCAFIGQPSEVAGLRNTERLRPELAAKVGITLSFFCAGSPTSGATVALVKKLGFAPEEVTDLRYRGRGWPGHFTVSIRGVPQPEKQLTYKESWGFLTKMRPYSIQLWPDGTGESADIACGDAWHRPPEPGNPGLSLVVIRTERGRALFHRAMAAGYLRMTPATVDQLAVSTDGLTKKKRALWGRRLAMRLFGLPLTRHEGVPFFRLWAGLSPVEQLKSVYGTVRRILTRKLHRPLHLGEADRFQL